MHGSCKGLISLLLITTVRSKGILTCVLGTITDGYYVEPNDYIKLSAIY